MSSSVGFGLPSRKKTFPMRSVIFRDALKTLVSEVSLPE